MIQVWVPPHAPVLGDPHFVAHWLMELGWLQLWGSDTREQSQCALEMTYELVAPGGQGHHPVCLNVAYFVCIF